VDLSVIEIFLFLITVGILLGLASGFVGASAVSLVVPILFVFFKLDILVCLCTSLLVDIITASVVAVLYWKKGNTDLKMGLIFGILSFSFAIIGSLIAFLLASFSENILSGLFGWAQIGVGIMMIKRGITPILKNKRDNKNNSNTIEIRELILDKKRPQNLENNDSNNNFVGPEATQIEVNEKVNGPTNENKTINNNMNEQKGIAKYLDMIPHKWRRVIMLIIGIFIGLNAGLFGAGGGFMVMILLIFLLNYPTLKAVGTATFIMILTALGAFISYYVRFGFIGEFVIQYNILFFALIIGVSAIGGAFLGTFSAHKLSENYLKIVIGVIIIIFGIIMLI